MLGAAFGGLLLDHISIAATLIGGTILLTLASLIVGSGDRIKPLGKVATVAAPCGDREFLRKIATVETRSCATRNGIGDELKRRNRRQLLAQLVWGAAKATTPICDGPADHACPATHRETSPHLIQIALEVGYASPAISQRSFDMRPARRR
jgi:hypothetical protein